MYALLKERQFLRSFSNCPFHKNKIIQSNNETRGFILVTFFIKSSF